MSIRISNVSLPVEEDEAALPEALADLLDVSVADIRRWRILRKSLDVRDKRAIKFIYSAEVEIPTDEAALIERLRARGTTQIDRFTEEPFFMPDPGSVPLTDRPVVVGSGPGGLVAGYFLALHGYRPIILERGTPVHQRIKDVRNFDEGGDFEPESNYLFGEGGAGTFSDGKLTCRGSGPDVTRVLHLFLECKGKPSILYEHRPHLGSNRLPAVVKAIRQRIESLGGEVRFLTKVEDLRIEDGRITGVATSSGMIPAQVVVLATGHSARDVYSMLHRRGVPITRKPFQMGVRIEHSQETVNRVQYGANLLESKIGSADYSLSAHGTADVFTFCMCAGGYIIPSVSEKGIFCTNGMSLSKRDSPFANSGLVVTIPIEQFGGDDPLAGVRLQEKYEKRAFELGRGEYRCPMQRATDFMALRKTRSLPKNSYPRGAVPIDLAEVLPPFVLSALRTGLPKMDRRWQGRFLAEAVLAGPEARGSSPIRIVREDGTRESPGVRGLYPVGEGAGYAGGIVSAAVDGLRTARSIIAKYAALERR